jgi:pimeloyl-ACP methyl ester carboxylesterase
MTFVLVHGAGGDHRCWDLVTPQLDGRAVAVDLPGRGRRPADLDQLRVADFVAAVVDDLEADDLTEVVLVGHSLGCITLPGVAARVPERVARMVFISGPVPEPGHSVIESVGGLSPAVARITEQLGPDAINTDGSLHPSLMRALFCNDMDDEQFARVQEIAVPEAPDITTEVLGSEGLPPTVPCTYIRLLRDASLTRAGQDEMASRLGDPEIRDVDAGHMAMITQPAALAAVLNDIAHRQ